MIFLKSYKNKGIILADILLALALGGLFAALLFESSVGAREVFERARERDQLIDLYVENADQFEGMMPYDSRVIYVPFASSTVSIVGKGMWYGNDRFETEITVDNKVTFSSVRPYPFENVEEAYKTPICSVDFTHDGDISIVPIILPIDPLIPLTDLEVKNRTAYISTDSTRAVDPDILIADISNHSSTTILSSLNTGPGIAAFSLVHNRIYAAAVSTASQIHIIRIDSLNDLILEKKYTLPLPSTTTPPTVGSSIFYARNHIYVGTEKWDGKELNIFDISNAPELIKKGSVEIGSKINDIFVRNDSAYIAASAEKQLSVIGVEDTDNPIILNSISPSGWSRQEGKTLSFFEDELGLGRTSGGFDIRTDYEMFQWASTSLTSLNNPDVHNMPGGVYGIVSDRLHTYVASREPGRELQVFDRTASSTIKNIYSLPTSPQRMTCDNDRLYVLSHSTPVIYEISFN